jgi:hypothetical protein
MMTDKTTKMTRAEVLKAVEDLRDQFRSSAMSTFDPNEPDEAYGRRTAFDDAAEELSYLLKNAKGES